MPSIAPIFRWPRPRRGLAKHLHPFEVPPDALRDAENWINRFGTCQIRPGLSHFAAFPDSDPGSVIQRPLGFHQYDHESENRRIVCGTNVGLFHYNVSTEMWDDKTDPAGELSGGPTSQVVFRTFVRTGVTNLLFCNGQNPPKVWDGTSSFYRDIGGSPPVARCMAISARRLLLASGYNLKCSDLIDFENGWGTNLDANIFDTPGDITAMLERGNLVTALYKESSIYNVIAQDDINAPYRIELAVAGVSGPPSPLSVVQGEDGAHYYIARNGEIIRFDGANAMSLGEAVQAAVVSAIDYGQVGRAWAVYHRYFNEFWFFFQPAGADDVNYAIRVNASDFTHEACRWRTRYLSAGIALSMSMVIKIGELVGSIGDQDLTIGEYARVNRSFLVGATNGSVYQMDGSTDDGLAIHHYLETGVSDGGDPAAYKTASEVAVDIEESHTPQTVSVEIAYQSRGNQIAYAAAKTVNLNTTGVKRCLHRVTAQRFGLKISGESSEQITFGGALLSAGMRGRR